MVKKKDEAVIDPDCDLSQALMGIIEDTVQRAKRKEVNVPVVVQSILDVVESEKPEYKKK